MDSSNMDRQRTKLPTKVLKIDPSKLGEFVFEDAEKKFLGEWRIKLAEGTQDAANLRAALLELRVREPVAFPTETVYGLGADATRSSAIQHIYEAKQRPQDNPLIVHIASLSQLRYLFNRRPCDTPSEPEIPDTIPRIYHNLIYKYWPGPLTIILNTRYPPPFVLEVTNGLPTVGIRMPASPIALALIQLSGMPLAAPSANSSSKPSPTTAAHVLYDLNGRIRTIIDGGPCSVGLESTVVDGLSDPPVILRPGAISLEMLRECPGWENVQIAYGEPKTAPGKTKNSTVPESPESLENTAAPRAPGMKYKHYSPKATVVTIRGPRPYDDTPTSAAVISLVKQRGARKLGILKHQLTTNPTPTPSTSTPKTNSPSQPPNSSPDTSLPTITTHSSPSASTYPKIETTTLDLGSDMAAVARNLFAGLRELDLYGVDIIVVEGTDAFQGDLGAAVMNRLSKAAEMEF